jgi:hypothetical protein
MSLSKKNIAYHFDVFKQLFFERISTEGIDLPESIINFVNDYSLLPKKTQQPQVQQRVKKAVKMEDKNETHNISSSESVEIWMENIDGICYYLDKNNNLYSVEGYNRQQDTSIKQMKKIGEYAKDESGNLFITHLFK